MRNFIFIYLIAFLSCSQQNENECDSFTPEISDKYDFPIRPGTPEWSELSSGQEMIDASQIPSEILLQISSYGLLETCLDYPLLSTITAFDTIQFGTERQINNFNGLQELTSRKDAGKLMLSRFKQMNPYCPPDGISTTNYSLEFIYFGMIQSQNIFIEQLTSSERRELISEAIAKYDDMLANGNPYSFLNRKVVILIMARTMAVYKYPPFLEELSQNSFLRSFLNYGELSENEKTLNTILNYATNF